ncbi:hypothetical protein BDY21DRAFT_353460 [Lineolata rhizophorae]|uniref:Uncharacterized protein n=1 Tax=Lineolata rhizophorae TaxID=578093 RepID=A0A6A6NS63_9PEZI|nr:hypothetical protein BDY21DRAFT_353460 [Lineolata rhizophorae]
MARSARAYTLIQRRSQPGRALSSRLKKPQATTFATFQTPANLTSEQTTQARPSAEKCLCGRPHEYIRCYYFNPSIRPQGWILSPKVEQLIRLNIKKLRLDAHKELEDLLKELGTISYMKGQTHAYAVDTTDIADTQVSAADSHLAAGTAFSPPSFYHVT